MTSLESARASVSALLDDMHPLLGESEYSVTRQTYGAAQRCGVNVTDDDPPALEYTAANTEEVQCLIEQASSFPIAFDALAIVAADIARRGQPIPPPLSDWSSKVLLGEIARPRKKVGKHDSRDFVICMAVRRATEAGLPRSRNTATSGGSAFDLVAECLQQRRIPAGYDGVKKVWERRTK